MDLIIIGAGLSGAVVANIFAKKGKKVLILEKRKNIGGNVFDELKDGVLVHKYGPHIFHTNDDEVYQFMNKFWELNGFKNKVEGLVDGEISPIPFNFRSVDTFWPNESEEIKNKLINKYGLNKRVFISDLLNQEDEQLAKVANFVFKNVFENYTSKMWGIEVEKIDPKVLQRVPIIIGYEDTYFNDKYEGLPKEGYTKTIEKMLDHPNIEVKLQVNAVDALEFNGSHIFYDSLEVKCPIVMTGSIDEFCDYKFGEIPYRSLFFEFNTIKKDRVQNTAVLNLPAHPTITRTTEYKIMTKQDVRDKTVISSEQPGEFKVGDAKFGEPYYPIENDINQSLYNKYVEYLKKYDNVHLAGRLGLYKYLNMDQTVSEAIRLAKKLLGE